MDESPYHQLSALDQRKRLQELAIAFLRLGTLAFGGPAAHVAMMDQEFVNKRQWLDRQRLMDMIGLTNLIPGPNSTELAIHIGLERGGWLGLIIAGSCFILPAMLIVWVLAIIYVQYQALPQLGWVLYGVKPVIMAIVVQALWRLGKLSLKNIPTAIAGISVIALFALGINEILLLLLSGLSLMIINWKIPPDRSLSILPPLLLVPTYDAIEVVSNPVLPVAWEQIFLTFLKIGSVLYGGGYVILAFLQKEIVERSHWLSSQQILDAVAIGQFTPGPVFTTATFIGYLVGGHAGAIAATVGIFLPSFILVALISPIVEKLRRSPLTAGFLDGVNAAALGLMAVVTWQLLQSAIVDWLTIVLAIISSIVVFRSKVNSVWLIISGGAIGCIYKLLI